MKSISLLALSIAIAIPSITHAQGWTAGPSVPTAGNAPRAIGVALHSSSGFLLLGGTPLDAAGDAPVNALVSGSWVARSSLEGGFLHGGAAEDSLGRIIVFAGVDAGGSLGDSFHWTHADGDAGGIEERSDQAADHRFAVATDSAGLVYAIGGSGPSSPTVAASSGRVEGYDAATDTWSVLAPMPTPVADASACVDGQGRVLVFGGYDSTGTRTANVAAFNIASGTWSDTAVPDVPAARSGAGAVLGADGLIYVVGGADATGPQATTFILDPVAGTWRNGPTMLHAREHFGCTLDDVGNVWAIGGTTTNTTEMLFTPTCPTVLAGPTDTNGYRGASASLTLTLDGTEPFTFTWRANGTPLLDGPTGSGSTIVGANTAQLSVLGLTNADAVLYDCVISNACGTTTTAAAQITIIEPAALPVAFVARNIHPAGALSSSASSIDGDTIVGTAGYPHPQYNSTGHPMAWDAHGTAAPRDLTPANSVGGAATTIRGDSIVGWWWWPYTTPQGTGYHQNASVWTANGTVHHQAQVSGQEFGSIADTDGTHHVGTLRFDESSTNTNGYYWPATGRSAARLTPPTAWGSSCNAIDGDCEFGQVHIGFGVTHAAKWIGTNREFIDVHPAGANRSWVTAAGDGLQVGTAYYADVATPGFWSGNASSFTPVPAASLRRTRYGLLLGSRSTSGVIGAAVWRASADDWMDLHQFVPAEFSNSFATDVFVDPATDEMIIVGYGRNGVTDRTEAIVWRTANTAATVQTIGYACPTQLELHVVADSLPILGTSFVIALEGITPATTSASLLLGFSNPNIDLTGILPGLDGCGLWVNPAGAAISTTLGATRATTSLAMPATPALAGVLRFYLQGVRVAPGETAFGIVLGDGLEATVGF